MLISYERNYIRCPACHGSKFEPSPITKCRTWCQYCEGQGYFNGRPQRLMTLQEYAAAEREYQTSARDKRG